MSQDYPDMAVDADGIPILTERVALEPAAPPAAEPQAPPRRSARQIVDELLESESIRLQLDHLAHDLADDIRLQIEQSIAVAMDEAINKTMESHKQANYEYTRAQLQKALPGLLINALQDADTDA